LPTQFRDHESDSSGESAHEAIHLYELKGNAASASVLRGRLAEAQVDVPYFLLS
jgi:hypothetical protein